MKILLLGPEAPREKSSKDFEATFLTAKTSSEAMSLLQSEDIQIVVCDLGAKWQETIDHIHKDRKDVAVMSAADFASINTDYQRDYVRIDIGRLSQVNPIPCDVFLELSPTKYLKIINANELYSEEMISKLEKKNRKWLFVAKEQHTFLSSYLYKSLAATIKADRNKTIKRSVEEAVPIDLKKTQAVMQFIQNMKIGTETIERLNEISNNSMQMLTLKSCLQKLLENFKKSDSFISGHSLMVSHICCLIAQEMSWTTKSTLQKLSMAAILHDSVLTDDALAMTESLEVAADKFSKAEVQRLRRHPIEVALIVNSMNDVQPDIGNIILNHHEKPDGTGYPKGLSAQHISQISALFIVAHDFVFKVYGQGFTPKLVAEVKEYMDKTYAHSNFKTSKDALIRVMSRSTK